MAEGVQFTVTFLGGLGYGFWSSWRVSLTVLVTVPFMIASAVFVLRMNQTQTARANSSYAKAGSIVYSVRLFNRVGVYVSSIWKLLIIVFLLFVIGCILYPYHPFLECRRKCDSKVYGGHTRSIRRSCKSSFLCWSGKWLSHGIFSPCVHPSYFVWFFPFV
jgi:hypothetical protein